MQLLTASRRVIFRPVTDARHLLGATASCHSEAEERNKLPCRIRSIPGPQTASFEATFGAILDSVKPLYRYSLLTSNSQ